MALHLLMPPLMFSDNLVNGFPAILLDSLFVYDLNHTCVLCLVYDDPGGSGAVVAPDICVSPVHSHVQGPILPYPGPPPGDFGGNNPHARIICEIALYQNTRDWESKCQCWLREQYVRYVFGIKLHGMRDGRNAQGQNHRSMTAKLWTQGAPPPGYIEVKLRHFIIY
ncbi:hypothetical protein BC936DRAFT_142044 [Jimgerdemannia flammicorona]|uniref:Uncharacterized protein n=1 Tax=Jimgerdemannia flammicorona TaxID=994334 RepID=A0A433A114_9FUNG|nr:hypothetical protein BC936DRAFT_142044 [Jimgerdemannia flammicorona]